MLVVNFWVHENITYLTYKYRVCKINEDDLWSFKKVCKCRASIWQAKPNVYNTQILKEYDPCHNNGLKVILDVSKVFFRLK
jgi:hypothetical protein